MGMLLYMMEVQAKEAAEKAAQKPVPKKEPEKKAKVEVVAQAQEEKPVKKAKKPSRVEIMRMNVATVRAYAEEQGIENASTMSGAELKRLLVNNMLENEE